MLIIEISKKIWLESVKDLPGYSFFSSPAWLEVTANHFSLTNKFLKVERENKPPCYIAIQQKGNIAYSNFIGYGGFISSESIDEDLFGFFVKEIEIRYDISIARIKCHYLSPVLVKSSTQDTFIFKVPESEDKTHFSKKIIYELRKNPVGLLIRPLAANDSEELYDLYLETVSRNGSSYVTPKDLFKSITEMSDALILGAFVDNKLHAASVFMHDAISLYYWWNMSDTYGLHYRLNYALIKYALNMAISLQVKFFDMASSHSPEQARFKKNWGAKPTPIILFEK
jgi:hypothetical protein